MLTNPVLESLLNRKSIRKYTDQEPTGEVIEAVVRAGQQAPFAGQIRSILLSRDRARNAYNAPLQFTVCVDVHKLEMVMAKRNWPIGTCDLSLLIFGTQDAMLCAQNMVTAAESLGMGSCFLGDAPFKAEKTAARFRLPKRVFPITSLCMGYPAEDPPVRPRYPLDFSLFEERYPEFTDAQIETAMAVMDDGYLAQDYYRKADYMVELESGREETFTFDTYSWTEHMGRKWGQWLKDPQSLLEQLEACGFHITRANN